MLSITTSTTRQHTTQHKATMTTPITTTTSDGEYYGVCPPCASTLHPILGDNSHIKYRNSLFVADCYTTTSASPRRALHAVRHSRILCSSPPPQSFHTTPLRPANSAATFCCSGIRAGPWPSWRFLVSTRFHEPWASTRSFLLPYCLHNIPPPTPYWGLHTMTMLTYTWGKIATRRTPLRQRQRHTARLRRGQHQRHYNVDSIPTSTSIPTPSPRRHPSPLPRRQPMPTAPFRCLGDEEQEMRRSRRQELQAPPPGRIRHKLPSGFDKGSGDEEQKQRQSGRQEGTTEAEPRANRPRCCVRGSKKKRYIYI